ncbi:MAG: helix-turn-helix domain-containing protein [Phycisphaerae bacterium]|nr:helix-turn-helix domain-containing protein [Phycisphaerae bacterium]
MANKLPDDALLVDYKAVCAMLSVGKNAFFSMRQSGRFPIQPIRLGGSVRYNRRQVESWVESGCSPHWRPGR